MPQGRRKVPFSGKAKKEQLKAKKLGKQPSTSKNTILLKTQDEFEQNEEKLVQKINFQPTKSGRAKPNRYALQFFKETNEEIKIKKEQARLALNKLPEKDLEINVDDFFPANLEFPKRPPWSVGISKEQLDAQENRYFSEYLKQIEENFELKDLSYFELNLETWRQLWRVVEMSDVILFIVDIRYPAIMFPPSLYEYVTNILKKDFILVLNKIDLAPAPLVVAWKNYFEEKYPQLHIVMFTSLPGYNLVGKHSDKGGLNVRRKKGRIHMATEGTQQLFDVCKSLVGQNVDLAKWQAKIHEESRQNFDQAGDEAATVEIGETIHVRNDTEYHEYQRFHDRVLTIGCLGQPNVGKSSLMNAVMGKKVVSVSKTPGHTKHFQTIFLTENVKLCDCPGLVFPSKVPKSLQVLMGSFPIAQLREPFTTIQYLAERLDLVKLLRIQHPYDDVTWSAMDVCEGWAKKRGFLTAKAARLDAYRAANSLLRMALDGKICLCLRPLGYTDKKDFWQNHCEVEKVKWIQAVSTECLINEEYNHYLSSEEEDLEMHEKNSEEGEEEEEESSDENEEDISEEEDIVTNKFAVLEGVE